MPYPDVPPKRGEIYWVSLDPVQGSEQAGTRPVLILSLDSFNRAFPVVVVAALTTRIKDPNSRIAPVLAPGFPLDKASAVLTFQVRTIDQGRLSGFAGTIDEVQQKAVDYGLTKSFGLDAT